MSKINKQDKQRIVDGINQLKIHIKEKNFKEAHSTINQIKPIVTRTSFAQYELVLYQSFLAKDEGDSKSCIEFAFQALRLKPGDSNSQKLLILSYEKLNDNDNLQNSISTYLAQHEKDEKQDIKFLTETIAPHLQEFDEKHHDDITLPFVRCFTKIPDYQNYKIADFIPDTSDLADFRLSLLEPFAETDQHSCELLIEVLLYDCDKSVHPPSEILKYANFLTANDPLKLRVEIFYGPDPVQAARKFKEITRKDDFAKFVNAAEASDLPAMKSQLVYFPHFVSGWLYYGSLVENPQEQLLSYRNALKGDPASTTILTKLVTAYTNLGDTQAALNTLQKIAELDPNNGSKLLTQYIFQHQLFDDLNSLQKMPGFTLTPIDKANLVLYQYPKNKDKAPIREILDIQCNEQTAEIRAKAIYVLRGELGEKVQPLFAECLKNDRTNPTIYSYFARYLKEIGLLDKSELLLQKAYEYGSTDDDVCEVASRKFICDDKLDEALLLCLKVNASWSHFRAGLILQRQNKHELACKQFQIEITDNPNNITAWQALGQSYFVLGRIMDAQSVINYLKTKGQEYPDLEDQLRLVYEKPIIPSTHNLVQSFAFDKSPAPFYSYLAQEIQNIQRFITYGRDEASLFIIQRIEQYISEYITQWSTLASVHKICGDFYLTAFKATRNADYIKKSFVCMKKRAEIDIRAESFIDLSDVLIEMGQIEQAIAVLKKVIRKFPDNSLLWANLGVAFALSGNHVAFARHCLCVAAKIASDSERGKIYFYYSKIAKLLNDNDLAITSADAANRANPYDPDVKFLQMILAQQNETERVKKDPKSHKKVLQIELDMALVSYAYGATKHLIDNIPTLMLQLGRIYEGLGFALLSRNKEFISSSYEALGQYDVALTFAQDENTTNRLKSLLGQSQQIYQVANLCNEKNYQEALACVMSQNCQSHQEQLIKDITIGILYGLMNENEKAVKVFNQLRKRLLNENASKELIEHIHKLQLIYSSSSDQTNLKPELVELAFLNNLRLYSNDMASAAKKTLEGFPSNIKALTIYLIVAFQNLDKLSEYDPNQLLKCAKQLVLLNPSRISTKLLLFAQFNAQKYKDAYKTISSLYLMAPEEILKTKTIFKCISLNKNIEVEEEDYDDEIEFEEEEDNY